MDDPAISASVAIATAAAAATIGMTLLQTDYWSRRVLSPRRLYARRHAEYRYQWTQLFLRIEIQLQLIGRRLFHSDSDSSNTRNSDDSTTALAPPAVASVDSTTTSSSSNFSDGEIELLQTELILTDDKIKSFIQEKIVAQAAAATAAAAAASPGTLLRIGKIMKDARIGSGNGGDEYYVWIYETQPNLAAAGLGDVARQNNTTDENHEDNDTIIYQLPLLRFGVMLAEQLIDEMIFTTTFCFIHDASGGQASQLIVDLVTDNPGINESCGLIREPTWMIYFARLVQLGAIVVPRFQLERLFISLCRFEAIQQKQYHSAVAGGNHHSNNAAVMNTLIMTIPGQALTSTMLPFIHKAFPYDRHVFTYQGCYQTCRSISQRLALPSSQRCRRRDYLPPTMEQMMACDQMTQVHVTTPLLGQALVKQSAYISDHDQFMTEIARLPVEIASIVECWMLAVDTYLAMKEHDEKVNEFLPYVLKLDYLLPAKRTFNNKANRISMSYSMDQYWTLRSLIQFMTGNKSRELPKELSDATTSWLYDYVKKHDLANHNDVDDKNSSTPASLRWQHNQIDRVVFQHKRILIGNKTLIDTVQPQQHWTLKNALKRGCACCAPEDDEEEAEKNGEKFDRDDELFGGGASTTTTAAALGTRNRDALLTAEDKSAQLKKTKITQSGGGDTAARGYVDGKTTFAFDPTKFA